MNYLIASCAASALLSTGPLRYESARAEKVVDTFERGINAGGWTLDWFNQPMTLTEEGGNPGWMLRQQFCCDSFSPRVHTVGASAFTGNFRDMQVERLAVDARVFSMDPPVAWLSLRLETDAGTPDDPADDYAAFFQGGAAQQLPRPDSDPATGLWRTIVFKLPSQSTTLPDGWAYQAFNPLLGSVPKSADWSVLIQNVSGVSFEFGSINPVWPIHFWDLTIDNVTIFKDVQAEPSPDINGDGVVDVDDLLLMINAWDECEPKAECAPDLNSNGVVDVDDLLMLLNAWTA